MGIGSAERRRLMETVDRLGLQATRILEMTTQQIPPSDNLPLDDRPLPRDWARDRRDQEHPLGPLRPIGRFWPVVLVVMLLCAGAGAAVGLKRSPTWTASSTINVGRVDVRVQALPGYVAGAETLAGAYSRIVDSPAIVNPVGRKLGMSPAQVAAHVSATPVPSAPMFRIIGTAGSQARAIQLTNAVTYAMKRYVKATDNGQSSLRGVLRSYERESATADRLQRKLSRMQGQRNGTVLTTASTPSQADIRKVRVQYQSAQLRAQALAAQYQNRSEEVGASAGLQVISTPLAANSDRKSKLQRLVAVGLVGGLVAGSLLALLFDAAGRRRRRRRLA
jgi:capsular polysaccharide biosynthesis protein